MTRKRDGAVGRPREIDPPEESNGAPSARQPRGASAPGGVQAETLEGGLYLVATPIGNAEDLGLRAARVIERADILAMEDTRVSAKLIARLGLAPRGRRLGYAEHAAERQRPKLLAALAEGRSVALISDAGTPLVSDPGLKLVRAAIAGGLPVTAVPGPSAVLTALQLSGLPSDRFLFAGFLPPKAAARRRALEELAAVPASLIFFEAPQRLAASLADRAEVLGPRPAAVARELTKRFEELTRAPLDRLAAEAADADPPKGEITLVVGPPEARPALDPAEAEALLHRLLASHSLRDAVRLAAEESGLPRQQLYRQALALSRDAAPDEP